MSIRRNIFSAACAVAILLTPLNGAETAGGSRGGGASDFEVSRKLRAAEQLLEIKEYERAVSQLQNMLERHPESKLRFKVLLTLGRHYITNVHDGARAIEHLKQVQGIERTVAEGEKLLGEDLDTLLESLYLTGVAHYEQKQYEQCFPILRRITTQHPNTVWANQAYYYIGMAHFVQKNWGKAIRYLSLVGTYIDPEAETAQYVEAGHRLYVKITDADLPILQNLGRLKYEKVLVEAASGDKAELALFPLSLRESIYIATIQTEVGAAKDDDILQIVGGDRITVRYVDSNTKDGSVKVVREKTVEVVSTASVTFTDATWEGKAKAAYTGHPMDIQVVDVDRDLDEGPQTIRVKVQARYLAADEAAEGIDDFMATNESADGPRWEVRDEVEIELRELPNEEGGNLYRTGRFVGKVAIDELKDGAQADRTDNIITCRQKDLLVVTYLDERHINGEFERVVEDKIEVIGPWKSHLTQTNNQITDPMLESRKAISEGQAFLALSDIFKSMGLMDGAQTNVDEGLSRANLVISREDEIAEDVRQEAFKLRWELYLTIGDLKNAILTCKLFNQAFPQSRFADQALMTIGRTHIEMGDYDQAIAVFQQIISLTQSDSKDEAQFRIAEATEKQLGALEPAIPMYQKVADSYPDSIFTGDALAKMVTYHIESNDYVTAHNLLTIIFEEHPDKPWLDGMLVRWVILAYRMGDYDLAYQKAQQLLFEYPDSVYAKKVTQMLKNIEKKRGANTGAAAGATTDDEGDK